MSRAEISQPEVTFAAEGPSRRFVAFRFEQQAYALPLEVVETIVRMVAVARVPEAPPWISGVIDLHGRVLPVVDLRRRFGHHARSGNPDDRLLVIRIAQGEIALVADEVTEVMDVAEEQLEDPPEALSRLRPLASVIRQAEGLTLVLDSDRLLPKEEDWDRWDQYLEQENAHEAMDAAEAPAPSNAQAARALEIPDTKKEAAPSRTKIEAAEAPRAAAPAKKKPAASSKKKAGDPAKKKTGATTKPRAGSAGKTKTAAPAKTKSTTPTKSPAKTSTKTTDAVAAKKPTTTANRKKKVSEVLDEIYDDKRTKRTAMTKKGPADK